nr:hypothetical protein BgiMline_021193 [Biomphalaria glabrata]
MYYLLWLSDVTKPFDKLQKGWRITVSSYISISFNTSPWVLICTPTMSSLCSALHASIVLLLCLSLTVVTDAKNCDSVALAKKPLSQVIRMFGQGHGEQADDNTIRSHPPFVPAPFVTKVHPFATRLGYKG